MAVHVLKNIFDVLEPILRGGSLTDEEIEAFQWYLEERKRGSLTRGVINTIRSTQWDKSSPEALEERFNGSEFKDDFRYQMGQQFLDMLDWEEIYEQLKLEK